MYTEDYITYNIYNRHTHWKYASILLVVFLWRTLTTLARNVVGFKFMAWRGVGGIYYKELAHVLVGTGEFKI